MLESSPHVGVITTCLSHHHILEQGIIDCKGLETFAKEPKLTKFVAGVKVDAFVVQQKKSTGFCHMSVIANLLHLGCFSLDNL